MPQPRKPRPGIAPRSQGRNKTEGETARSGPARAKANGVRREGGRPASFTARDNPYGKAFARVESGSRPAVEPVRQGPLSPSQKRYLRGFAHLLKPIIRVGQKGVTPALLEELDGALAHHELVKVKLADGDRESRTASIERIRADLDAELVQAIGHVACFYRLNPDKAAYTLPR